jgi:hypothetical protein
LPSLAARRNFWEAMGKGTSSKAQLRDGSRVEKSIFARVAKDGRITAFQVKIHASGAQHAICESFDCIEEARSFRDSVRADLALDPYKAKVLRAREEGRAARKMAGLTLGDLLSDYLAEVTPTKKNVCKRVPNTLLTRVSSQTSTTGRRSANATRQVVPSPGSMVAVRWLMRTTVPTTV